MTIPNKATFNNLSQRGLLGNFLPVWNDIDAALASGCQWFTIQSHQKESPWFEAIVGIYQLKSHAAGMISRGAPAKEMYFREIPPPDTIRKIQFEAYLGPSWAGDGSGVNLFYELDTTKPVRGIRERCSTASGLKAQAILRAYLEPSGYDTLMDIWDRYPTAIVEASEFGTAVGAFCKNLVVWEVRNF